MPHGRPVLLHGNQHLCGLVADLKRILGHESGNFSTSDGWVQVVVLVAANHLNPVQQTLLLQRGIHGAGRGQTCRKDGQHRRFPPNRPYQLALRPAARSHSVIQLERDSYGMGAVEFCLKRFNALDHACARRVHADNCHTAVGMRHALDQRRRYLAGFRLITGNAADLRAQRNCESIIGNHNGHMAPLRLLHHGNQGRAMRGHQHDAGYPKCNLPVDQVHLPFGIVRVRGCVPVPVHVGLRCRRDHAGVNALPQLRRSQRCNQGNRICMRRPPT